MSISEEDLAERIKNYVAKWARELGLAGAIVNALTGFGISGRLIQYGTPGTAQSSTMRKISAGIVTIDAASDVTVTITGDVSIPQATYSDEQAQDAVGSILDDSGDIDFTYDDATPKITAVVKTAAVTYAKMQDVSAASKLLGRGSASGSGDVEEITIGTGLTMSGTTLSAPTSSTDKITAIGVDNSQVVVANTVTETSLYSDTVPGGTLSTANHIECDIFMRATNPGSADTHTFRAKYGGTTVATLVLTINGVAYPWLHLHVVIKADASASAQRTLAGIEAIYSDAFKQFDGDGGTSSVSSGSDQTFEVTVQHSAANANLNTTKETARLVKYEAA